MSLPGQLALDFNAPPGDAQKPRKRPAYKHTSRQAYRDFAPVSGSVDYEIIVALRDAGAGGLICEAIEDVTGHKHQTVSGNLRHLVEDGYARDSGFVGHTKSKRKAIKWVLTEKGRRVVE